MLFYLFTQLVTNLSSSQDWYHLSKLWLKTPLLRLLPVRLTVEIRLCQFKVRTTIFFLRGRVMKYVTRQRPSSSTLLVTENNDSLHTVLTNISKGMDG